jgi:hypothetical protein
MKKEFVFIFASLLTYVSISGQGNLQFNQIVIVSNTFQTVPQGKVWKIESYLQQQVTVTNQFSEGCSGPDISWRLRPFYIDNIPYYSMTGVGYGAGNETFRVAPLNPFPIWLGANQVVHTTCQGDILSIVEFNIIP